MPINSDVLPAFKGESVMPTRIIKVGDNDVWVKRVQEWLCLRGFKINIDGGQPTGGFGPATAEAVKQFQAKNQLPETSTVDVTTYQKLIEPLVQATTFVPEKVDLLGDAVVAVAQKHLAVHPIEVGGDNCGPWVRQYCKGFDGAPYAWCQGFASSVIEQTCMALGVVSPIPLVYDGQFSLYVPTVVNGSKQVNRFVSGLAANAGDLVHPGSFFFVRSNNAPYHIHVGIVVSVSGDRQTITTIEGNTNTDGSANGWEVAKRIRRITSCDYGII